MSSLCCVRRQNWNTLASVTPTTDIRRPVDRSVGECGGRVGQRKEPPPSCCFSCCCCNRRTDAKRQRSASYTCIVYLSYLGTQHNGSCLLRCCFAIYNRSEPMLLSGSGADATATSSCSSHSLRSRGGGGREMCRRKIERRQL